MPKRPLLRMAMATLKPPPTSPRTFSMGTGTFSKYTSAVLDALMPIFFSGGPLEEVEGKEMLTIHVVVSYLPSMNALTICHLDKSVCLGPPEWSSGLRHCIAVASLQTRERSRAVSQLAMTWSLIGQCTIDPASSGLGEGLAGGASLGASCSCDSLRRMFPLTHWCTWLPG